MAKNWLPNILNERGHHGWNHQNCKRDPIVQSKRSIVNEVFRGILDFNPTRIRSQSCVHFEFLLTSNFSWKQIEFSTISKFPEKDWIFGDFNFFSWNENSLGSGTFIFLEFTVRHFGLTLFVSECNKIFRHLISKKIDGITLDSEALTNKFLSLENWNFKWFKFI